jgi:hypothetical protein
MPTALNQQALNLIPLSLEHLEHIEVNSKENNKIFSGYRFNSAIGWSIIPVWLIPIACDCKIIGMNNAPDNHLLSIY